MKIRSSLLFACMLVVPLLAMFSHKIPPDLRQAARRHVWEPAQRSLMTAFGSAAEPATAAVTHAPVTPALALEPTEPPPAKTLASLPAEPVRMIAADRSGIEDRLAALGAFSFECAPVNGADGLHRCSCRVAADPSGQLQRVFQSSDRDPGVAMQQLLGQVQAWRQRIAAGQPSPGAPAPPRRFH